MVKFIIRITAAAALTVTMASTNPRTDEPVTNSNKRPPEQSWHPRKVRDGPHLIFLKAPARQRSMNLLWRKSFVLVQPRNAAPPVQRICPDKKIQL